ncbi:MAG: biosynthetic peptidoglycan transglycosylase, partial [Candidatus Micrarchaeaceae archaeon]
INDQIGSANTYFPQQLTSLEKMVVILEDRRFFNHHGVDFLAVIRELAKLLIGKRHGGASTIDMQLVRTVTGYKALTIKRKLYECILAIIIQRRYNKTQILRSYMNCAFFGSHLIGATRASQALFGQPPTNLDDSQAAFIAAMLVCPKPMRSTPKWESRVKRRADYGYSIYISNKDRFDKLPC